MRGPSPEAAAATAAASTGRRCVITPNEVRQLMASGDIGNLAPGRRRAAARPTTSTSPPSPNRRARPARAATCTDPNRQITFAPDQHGGVVGPLPHSTRYPARKGYDEFYGYGRLNAYKAVSAAGERHDPARGGDHSAPTGSRRSTRRSDRRAPRATWTARSALPLRGRRRSRRPAEQRRRFPSRRRSTWCNGRTVRIAVLPRHRSRRIRHRAAQGAVPAAGLHRERRAPQDANGRPNTLPYAFTVRVLVTHGRADSR